MHAVDAVERALAERPESRPAGVMLLPTGYVSGQESAIVRWANERIAKPASPHPRVTDRGIDRRPTLVSNVETLAHVALIARNGARWFRQVGTECDPGTALVTLSGAIARAGVYEIAHGTSLRELVAAAGGLDEPARAYLVGGYAGVWLESDDLDSIRLAPAELQMIGARFGAGIVVALPRSACPVSETARVADWLAEHSSGQCGPCVNGLGAIADTLAEIRQGSADRAALALVRRWCAQTVGRGACGHPDGAVSFVASAMRRFAAEMLDHLRHGPCDACERPPVLVTPSLTAMAG